MVTRCRGGKGVKICFGSVSLRTHCTYCCAKYRARAQDDDDDEGVLMQRVSVFLWCVALAATSRIVCVQFCKHVLLVCQPCHSVSVCLLTMPLDPPHCLEGCFNESALIRSRNTRSSCRHCPPHFPVIAMCTCVSYCLHAIEKPCCVCETRLYI